MRHKIPAAAGFAKNLSATNRDKRIVSPNEVADPAPLAAGRNCRAARLPLLAAADAAYGGALSFFSTACQKTDAESPQVNR
jgi:hypothetical protein